MSIYLDNPWSPVPHSIFKENSTKFDLDEKGFSIKKSLGNNELNKLLSLFNNNHSIKVDDGGMFYSIYSQNVEYRKQIHKEIKEILTPIVNEFCKDYKMILNSFVVKYSGPKSGFCLHQDTTGVNEDKYSPISLWIPLDDVSVQNGCLGLIPYSQHFFSPLRSISFPLPFDNIQNEVKKYLMPIPLNKGEILIFDNRLIHDSYVNLSQKHRIALICGLIPQEAQITTCHKPSYEYGGKVELIQHEDDFLLTGKNFLIDCQKRPDNGKSLGWVDDPYLPIEIEDFEKLCLRYSIYKHNDITYNEEAFNLIGEPNYKINL